MAIKRNVTTTGRTLFLLLHWDYVAVYLQQVEMKWELLFFCLASSLFSLFEDNIYPTCSIKPPGKGPELAPAALFMEPALLKL